MGQRHQIFLIARVIPHGDSQSRLYYRCIGAFHHQWSYGRLPLRAARRLIDLVQNKNNARIIREEIHAIQGKYGRRREKPIIPEVPCPYSTFLMASAITTDIEDPTEPYASGVSFRHSFLPAYMGSFDGDNNDGITVIDITDPEKPSYCFVLSRSEGPLSATEYVRVYYPFPSDEQTDQDKAMEESVLENIALLDGVPLVTLEMLSEAWPSEYAKSSKEQPEETGITSDEPVTIPVPSLAQLTIGPVVERGLGLDEMTEIEDIVWMASNAEMIRAILLAKDPFPDTGIALLTKVIRTGVDENKVIDLSGFHLSPEQIITITKQFEDAAVLDVSNMPKLTIDTILKVLPSVPNLRRLVLLGTSITDDEICDLLPKQATLFRHLEALIHPFFIKYAEEGYPNAFSIISLCPDMGPNIGAGSLPWFTPAQALQAIIDYISSFGSEDPFAASTILGASHVLHAAIASEVRHPEQKWSQRSVPLFSQHSLRALKGEGWFFAFEWKGLGYGTRHNGKYAFVKLDSESHFVKRAFEVDKGNSGDWGASKVCDLKQFLLNMQAENRPPPSPSAVDNLARVIKALDTKAGLALMSKKETKGFITKVIQYNVRRF